MMTRILCLAGTLVAFLAARALADDRPQSGTALTYERDVRPILKTHCFQCHGEGDKLKGKLDLRLRHLMVKGGKSGPAVVPGNRDGSLLYQRIRLGEMPPGKTKLSSEQVAVIGSWIVAGAKTARPEPQVAGHGLTVTSEDRSFWAFQPIRRPPIPVVRHGDRVRTPIDGFLLARLEAKGLSFGAEADRRTLIRRAYMDLTGLPPSPSDVAGFRADTGPDAYERMIDRLLASPQYGERWGRHWLDVAGYADSEGYTAEDPLRPHAYRYRDYVIRSLNADKPFDRFIQEQLAGDEMVRPPYQNLRPDDIDKLTATGFLRMAPDGTGVGGVDQDAARNQVVAETIKIVSTSLLGLTVGCAQCHDHRYDPIPQADYYRLRAVFEPAYDWKNWLPPQARRISLYTDADRKKAAEVETEAARVERERDQKQQEYIERTFEKELKKLPEVLREPIRAARKTPPPKQTPQQQMLLKDYPSVNVTAGSLYLYDHQAAEDLKKYSEKAAQVRATKPVEEFIRALTEIPGHVPATYVFARGDYAQPREAVLPGELSVIDSQGGTLPPAKDPSLPTSGRRLAYARRLTDGKHPLTARVLVNRVWMHHFGRGIVATPADFGALGQRPTHPELLDWLADEFMAGGWRLKRLHRLIMTSTAYRQTSERPRTALVSRDPRASSAPGPAGETELDNRLYGRMPVRRLEAEEIRDSILAAGGKLNAKMFGPPVPVMEDEVGQFVVGIENKNGENRPGPIIPLHGEEFRRSIYVQIRRTRPLGVLETFDEPVMEPNCAARNASTVAPQSLMFMNNEFIIEQAGYYADRLCREAGTDVRARVALAWRVAFGREPSAEEVKDALAYLADQTAQFRARQASKPRPGADPQREALASFCQALMSANQFLYVD